MTSQIPPRTTPTSSLGAAQECEVCGTSQDLRIAPLMTGDKFGQPPEHPVCGACFRAWFESGATTREGILSYREKYPEDVAASA